MVLLALTSAGLKEALRLKEASGVAVWCGAAAISAADFSNGGATGASRFIHDFAGPDKDDLLGALDTIEQHHPGEVVWVEGTALS